MVIPARNEASDIGKSIASLLQQSCVDTLQIFVVDDNSSDGTAEAARSVAAHSARAGQVSIVTGRPLPPGWSGKLWAVQQGIEQAAPLKPDFFLLTDADIEHAPDNIARLVAIAEDGSYDLASFMVKLHCRSFAEKLLIRRLSSSFCCCIRRGGFAIRAARRPAPPVAAFSSDLQLLHEPAELKRSVTRSSTIALWLGQ